MLSGSSVGAATVGVTPTPSCPSLPAPQHHVRVARARQTWRSPAASDAVVVHADALEEELIKEDSPVAEFWEQQLAEEPDAL